MWVLWPTKHDWYGVREPPGYFGSGGASIYKSLLSRNQSDSDQAAHVQPCINLSLQIVHLNVKKLWDRADLRESTIAAVWFRDLLQIYCDTKLVIALEFDCIETSANHDCRIVISLLSITNSLLTQYGTDKSALKKGNSGKAPSCNHSAYSSSFQSLPKSLIYPLRIGKVWTS